MPHPTKGGDYEIEDLDKASDLAVVCDHTRSPYLLPAEPAKYVGGLESCVSHHRHCQYRKE